MTEIKDLGNKVMEETKKHYKNIQKLKSEARFLIYQCVGPKVFNKISKVLSWK